MLILYLGITFVPWPVWAVCLALILYNILST